MLESDGALIDPHRAAAQRSAKDCGTLDSVVCTAELYQRPIRWPDYERQSRALLTLAQALADAPDGVLKSLTAEILTVLNCHSAGVSLLSDDATRFHWPAVAGQWRDHVGGGAPRNFGPCGDVLDCNAPILFRHPERRYSYLRSAKPPVVECLLVPFRLHGDVVGAIWAISHDELRMFDAEDLRQLESLGAFASAVYQAHGMRERELSQGDAAVRSHVAIASLQAELRASESAVQRGEGEFRDFVENATIGLNWLGADGTILWANQTELDMLGFDNEEYVGRHIADFHADQPVIKDILSRLAAGETVHDYGARLKGKDGLIRHVLITSNGVFESDVFVHTRCFTRDVTDRKHAEAVARERDAFNRSIIESSPDCIKVLDLEGNLLALYNGETLLGIDDLSPYLHRPWVEFWNGNHRPAAIDALARAVAGDEGRFVGYFRTLRNEDRWWDVRVSPIRGPDGKPERLLAVSRDVTERRHAELNLEFLASLSDDLLHFTDVDEMMHTVGARLGEFLGLSQCAFVEISETAETVSIAHDWHVDGVQSLIGAYRLSEFVEAEFIRVARSGGIIVVGDVVSDVRTSADKFAKLGIASFICVPLIRDGSWTFALCLYKGHAYEWRVDEIELARDLTTRIWSRLERLRTDMALRRSEERYRTLFDQMDEAFCVIELKLDDNLKAVDFRYLDANPSFERETGLTQVTGQWVSDVVPNLEAHWLETYAGVVRTGQPIRFVNEVAELDGRWFDLYAFRLGGEDSRQIAVLFRNIKQQLIAANALRESEERYRTLFESMDEAFCIIEMIVDEVLGPFDLRFLEVNPAFTRQTGRADAVGKRVREIAPDIDTSWIDTCARVSVTGEPVRFVNRWPELDAWFDVYAFRIGEADSLKVAMIFSNVTERVNSENALRDAAEAMVQLDRRKDEFLAMLGHELRNPLAPISNAVQLLRLQSSETGVQANARVIIERQLGQLTRLVDDLLEVSRINTGKIQLREERVLLNDVVERALEAVQPLVQQNRHTLNAELSTTDIVVFADAARLEQIFVNLLTNAAKYTNDGGHISLTVEQDGTAAVVHVRDSGVGIAPELLPHIFDVFTQAQRSLDRSQGGLGIGLSLVKRLVELHGGSVTVSSTIGEGSEFAVRLPMLESSLPRALPRPPAAGTLTPSTARCGVLVVDDNVDAAHSLTMLLQLLGHDVRLAYDGPTALHAAARYRPDLILLDIGLPGLTGFEVAERIRQDATLCDTILVAMTGYGQESDRIRSREVGFDHHMVKPADFDELQIILASVSASVNVESPDRGWDTLDQRIEAEHEL